MHKIREDARACWLILLNKRLYLLMIPFLFIMTCHQGLAPLEILHFGLDFPVPPEGGNPVGKWIPDTTKSVTVSLLDPEELPTLVDSLIIESELGKEGLFSFSVSGQCSINAVLKIEPIVYLQGLASPLVLSMNDTLIADGPYEIIDDKILRLSMETTFSQLDTLGFTSREDNLELISLPNAFPVPGFDDIQFFYVIYLTRSIEKTSFKNTFISVYRKENRGCS